MKPDAMKPDFSHLEIDPFSRETDELAYSRRARFATGGDETANNARPKEYAPLGVRRLR